MLETNCLDETEPERAVAIKLSAASHRDEPVGPVDIKKYGNRRLYNTATTPMRSKANASPTACPYHERIRPTYHSSYRDVAVEQVARKIWLRICNESWEDGMTSDVGQALLMLGGIICLIVLVIWAFWYLERFRGGNTARPGAQRR